MLAGLCRGGPNTSLATRGIMMEISDLNKSLCEELFGGEMDVMEKATDFLQGEKSPVKQCREWLYERNRKDLESLRKVEVALEKMDSFSRTKTHITFPAILVTIFTINMADIT